MVEITILSAGEGNVLIGDAPDRRLESVSRGELWSYRVDKPRAAALVFAGGGYVSLMVDREGVEVAQWLNANGYDAHVLVHRLPGQADGAGGVWPSDIALTDALAAVAAIGEGMPLVLVGLSSGGHLAGAVACRAACAGVIIAYAPINANHKDYKAPAGKPDYPPVQKQQFYNDWPIGIKAEPNGVPSCPVFLAYALHDSAVLVEHALNFIMTARDLGLDLDAHIFGQAPHGFALRERDGTQGLWPELALDWMRRKIS
jgi:acetyl esterase/lipase